MIGVYRGNSAYGGICISYSSSPCQQSGSTHVDYQGYYATGKVVNNTLDGLNIGPCESEIGGGGNVDFSAVSLRSIKLNWSFDLSGAE